MLIVRKFWQLTRLARALRFWLFVLLAIVGWFAAGVGEAAAQPVGQCGVGATGCTRAEAFAQCEALGSWRLSNFNQSSAFNRVENPRCTTTANAHATSGVYVCTITVYNSSGTVNLADANCAHGSFGVQHPIYATNAFTWNSGCPVGQEWFGGVFNRCSSTCESRPQLVSISNPKAGSIECSDGCSRTWHPNGDDFSSTASYNGGRCEGRSTDCEAIPGGAGNYFWNPIFGMCEPIAPECPPGQKIEMGVCVADDFCPIGQIMNAQNVCVPQEGDCPAGSERSLEGMCVDLEDDQGNKLCPEGQVRGSDGTCKIDEDGDGEPDEDDGKFSGGDDCKVPPTCSGDSILCGQARIQWRIDCNTRRNQTIQGGACSQSSMPVCVGESCDLMQYAQLMQAWKTACAVERLADGMLGDGEGGTGGPGDGDGDGRDADFDPYAAGEDDALSVSDDGIEPDDVYTDESANNDGAGGVPGGTGDLDDSGLGFSRGCPSLPSVSFMGMTIDFNATGVPLCDWMQLGGYFVLVIGALVSVRILSGGARV